MSEDERKPVATVAELDALDSDEIFEGYKDGWDNFPCGENRGRAYWHGWANAMRDKGKLPQTDAARSLAHELYLRPPPR